MNGTAIDDTELLYTKQEAAKLLRMHPESLAVMARARRIPHHRIGNRLFFARDDIQAFLAATRVPADV